jgi:hypothetical protein
MPAPASRSISWCLALTDFVFIRCREGVLRRGCGVGDGCFERHAFEAEARLQAARPRRFPNKELPHMPGRRRNHGRHDRGLSSAAVRTLPGCRGPRASCGFWQRPRRARRSSGSLHAVAPISGLLWPTTFRSAPLPLPGDATRHADIYCHSAVRSNVSGRDRGRRWRPPNPAWLRDPGRRRGVDCPGPAAERRRSRAAAAK